MVISTGVSKKNLYVFFDGELDSSAAPTLRKQLDELVLEKPYENVVFNFKKLSFMDSTGIGLILGRYKKIKNKGMTLYISQPSSQIAKVIKISGIDNVIPIIE